MPDVRTSELTVRRVAVGLAIYASLVALAPRPVWALLLGAAPLFVVIIFWTVHTSERWLVLFFFSAILLPPINLPFGNAGPHPALLAAGMGLLIGVIRWSEWSRNWDALTISLVTFGAVLLSSVPLAAFFSGMEVALGSLARVALFGISVYVFLFVRHGPLRLEHVPVRKVIRWLLWAATTAAAFACLDFYFQFPAPAGFGPQFVWLDSGVFRRAQGLFYEASTLGNFCVFFLVLILLAMFTKGETRLASRTQLAVCATVLVTAMVLSYSRASLINLFVAASVIALLHRKTVNARAFLKGSLVAVIAGAAALYLVFPAFAQTYWIRLVRSLQFFYEAPDAILSGRLHTWKQLWDFIAAEPWVMIAGIGYKTLPYTTYIQQGIVADNMYISLLIETGLIGLTAFALLNWNLLEGGLSAIRSSSRYASLLGTWFFAFWIGELVQMLSGDLLTYWRVLPIYLFVLALAQRQMQTRE